MKLISVITAFLFFHLLAGATTLQVGNGFPFQSIQSAIDTSSSGDTILVHPGLYQEGNIIIDKPLVVLGINWPVLDGQLKYEVVSIKADHVVMKGFQIINSGHASLEDLGGIKVYDSHHVQIIGNRLIDNFFGIYIQYSQNCLVQDNEITSSGLEQQLIGNGIHCWKSDSLQITGNKISGHRDGIYFEFVTASVIWRNISTLNIRYGLHFMFSNNDSYITNLFMNNGAGVAVMFTKNVKMYNNTFINNWGSAAYGLLLKEISDSEVFNNRFVENTVGVYMEGTNRINFENNIFKGNGWGLKIQASCMDNQLLRNNFLRNTFDVSTNGSLVLNKFHNNYWDKYEGYDLDRNQVGDVPFRPLSLFAVLAERFPSVMMLYRSFIVTLMDRSEKIVPTLTPGNFVDEAPQMHSYPL